MNSLLKKVKLRTVMKSVPIENREGREFFDEIGAGSERIGAGTSPSRYNKALTEQNCRCFLFFNPTNTQQHANHIRIFSSTLS